MIHIDANKAIALLREVVAGNEDFIYVMEDATCTYVRDAKPSCLIAQALAKAGVTVEQLREMDAQIDRPKGTVILGVTLPNGIEITGPAREVFSAAQKAQDQARPWGEALKNAEWRYARFEA